MDSHALLISQGWRGTGHSLHPTNDSIGLSNRLLVSNKQNVLGVGKKQHKTSDQWWLNAFDKELKGLDTSVQGQVVQTEQRGGLEMVKKVGHKWAGEGGLYRGFVRGEGLVGTLGVVEKVVVEEGAVAGAVESERSQETEEQRKARRAARRAAKSGKDSTRQETQEERRERRRLKKLKRAS